MEPRHGIQQVPGGGMRATGPPSVERCNFVTTPMHGSLVPAAAPFTASTERLMQLRRQIAVETARQDTLLQQLGALLAKYQQLALHDGLRTAPFLSVPPTVRRYRSFSITLGAPKGWFERLGLGVADVCRLGTQFTAVKSSTLVEAVGCRCIKNTSIISVRTTPEQNGGDSPFIVRRYRLYDHYVWTDCRINCSSSKTHYASDLRLCLRVPGCQHPVLSGKFAAVRMPKLKAETTDKFSAFVNSIYRPVPADAVVRMNHKEAFPVCAILHRKTSYSSLLVFGVLSVIATDRFRLYKAQTCGDLCCTFIEFDSLSQAQRNITEFLNFVMNDSIFSNITGKNIGNNVISGLVTQFGNFVDPCFDLNNDEVVMSYRNGTLTFRKPDINSQFYCYEKRTTSPCDSRVVLSTSSSPHGAPEHHDISVGTITQQQQQSQQSQQQSQPIAVCPTEQPTDDSPTHALLLSSTDGERSALDSSHPLFTLPYTPSPLFARSETDSPARLPSEGGKSIEQFGFFGGVDAASLFEESQGGTMMPFVQEAFPQNGDDSFLALDPSGFLDDEFLVSQQQLADKQPENDGNDGSNRDSDRVTECVPLDSGFHASLGEGGTEEWQHVLSDVATAHLPTDEPLAPTKKATKRVCIRSSDSEML